MPRSIAHLSENTKAAIRASGDDRSKLDTAEELWVAAEKSLAKYNYVLRPRYRNGWKASWTLPHNMDVDPTTCEDYVALRPPPGIIDAINTITNQRVCIKRVPTESSEMKILQKFAQLADDPRNHCVPLIEHFPDKDDSDTSYVVMPFLRLVDKPPFETVGQVLDFVTQMLEGLRFMHEHGVAHRDCQYNNVMMAADDLYPEGYHPIFVDKHPSYPETQEDAPHLRRDEAEIRYYFIDFGISVDVTAADSLGKFVVGIFGRDSSVPELSLSRPYDAFKVDIYILGNMFKKILHGRFTNVDFLDPLIEMMTQTDPTDRPSADDVDDYWRNYSRTLRVQRSAALQPRTPQSHREWEATPRQRSMLAETGVSLFGFAVNLGKTLFDWLLDTRI